MSDTPSTNRIARPNWLDAGILRLQRPGRPWSIMYRLRLHDPVALTVVDGALTQLTDARPELNVVLSGDGRELGWQSRVAPLRTTIAATESHLDADLDLRSQPPITVALNADPGDTLTIAVNHGLTDGLGGLSIVADMLAILGGGPPSSPPRVRSEDLDRFVAGARPAVAPPRPGACRPPTDERLATVVEVRRLAAAPLKAYADRAAVSISAVLIGAIHVALADHARPRQRVVVGAPVDLRRRAGLGNGVGNAVVAVSSAVRVPTTPIEAIAAADASLRDALRGRRLQRRLRAYRLIARPGSPRTHPRRDRRPRRPLTAFETAVLSNLGRLPPGGEWDQVAEISFAPPAHATISFGTVSLGPDLSIAVRGRLDRAAASDLVDQVVGLVGDRGS